MKIIIEIMTEFTAARWRKLYKRERYVWNGLVPNQHLTISKQIIRIEITAESNEWKTRCRRIVKTITT